MNFYHLLTLIFVLAKIFQVINWSWWVVFAPSIFAIVFAVIVILLAVWVSK